MLAALEERGGRGRDLFARNGDTQNGRNAEAGGRGVGLPPKPPATLQPLSANGDKTGETGLHTLAQPDATSLQPCTLEAYAEAKGLPVRFLKELGLSKISYFGSPAVRIPYFDEDGAQGAVRLRLAL